MDTAGWILADAFQHDVQYFKMVAGRDICSGEMHALGAITVGPDVDRVLVWVIDDQYTGDVHKTDVDGKGLILYQNVFEALISKPSWEELKNMDVGDRILSTSAAMTMGVLPRHASAAPGNNVQFMGIEQAKVKNKEKIMAAAEKEALKEGPCRSEGQA